MRSKSPPLADRSPPPPTETCSRPVVITKVSDSVIFSLTGTQDGKPSAVEWWFFQGWFEGPATKKRFFMCTFFRFQKTDGNHPGRPLYHLLVSELDPETGENAVLSQADPAISGWLDGCQAAGPDPGLTAAFLEELRAYGVPRPIIAGPHDPAVEARPFSTTWGDFSLCADDEGTMLTFPRPGDRATCRLVLEPRSPAWFCPDMRVEADEGMAYASIPRLRLKGTVDGNPVNGEAWADHQWGGGGWFQAVRPGCGEDHALLGWNWYGVNLDSGTDLMILVHWDAATRQIMAQRALIFAPDGTLTSSSSLELVTTGSWRSPRTGIEYPLVARIRIPDYGCQLTITPLAEDQEVPVPGPMRAVWEGAGRVRGTMLGKRIEGRARIELCGYGYIFDLPVFLSAVCNKIDEEILRFLPEVRGKEEIGRLIGDSLWKGEPRAYTECIAGPAWELLRRNKKYNRPLFALLLLHSLGVSPEPYFDLICIIPELIHAGSLIIDDIEDRAPIRRGGESIHVLFGEDVAINAANALYYLPWLLVEGHPALDDEQRLLLYRNMIRNAVRAHLGQAADIFWSKDSSADQILTWVDDGLEQKVLQMHTDKTGVAGAQAAYGCCVIARASREAQEACTIFSQELWTSFQIMDDVRDIMGETGEQRTPGADIAAGKLSYPIVKALGRLPEKDRYRLAEILATPAESKPEGLIMEGISIVRNSGAVEVCRLEVADRFARSWELFSGAIPPSGQKGMLKAFSKKMLTG